MYVIIGSVVRHIGLSMFERSLAILVAFLVMWLAAPRSSCCCLASEPNKPIAFESLPEKRSSCCENRDARKRHSCCDPRLRSDERKSLQSVPASGKFAIDCKECCRPKSNVLAVSLEPENSRLSDSKLLRLPVLACAFPLYDDSRLSDLPRSRAPPDLTNGGSSPIYIVNQVLLI